MCNAMLRISMKRERGKAVVMSAIRNFDRNGGEHFDAGNPRAGVILRIS
jgi:hypothetical protein